MTNRNLLALILLIVFTLTGCQTAAVPAPAPEAAPTAAVPSPESTPTPALTPVPEPDPLAERLAAMTVEEKVGQLLIGGFEGTEIGDQATRLVQEYQVGGLILYGRNIAGAGQLVTLTNGLKALNGDGIPLFLSIDQEGGGVDRMPPEVRRTPGAYCVGQTGSVPAAQSYGDVLAAECAAFGLNLDFAPVLDVWSNPGNTVIGQRAFSADARTVAGLGPAAARRMMDQGVIPAVKHFPGHGDTAVDSHVGLPVVDKSPEELEETERRHPVRRDGRTSPRRHGGPHPADPARPGAARQSLPRSGDRPAAGGAWLCRSGPHRRPDHGGHFQHLRYGGGRRTGRGGRL